MEIVVYKRAVPERPRGKAPRDRQQGYQGEHGERPGGERRTTRPAACGNSISVDSKPFTLVILCRSVEGVSQLAHTSVRKTDKVG